MNNLHRLTISAGIALTSFSNLAATHVADARGNAMGNTGVASADYLTAPFYNPALVADFKDNDDFGFLLPAIAINAHDKDDSLTVIDDLQSAIEDYEDTRDFSMMGDSQEKLEKINSLLNELDGNQPLSVTAGLGLAVALPSHLVSANLYTRAYAEVMAKPNVAEGRDNIEERYENSTVTMASFGYAEVGIAVARGFTVAEHNFSLGITPKYQQMMTYYVEPTVADFDIDDFEDSENKQTAFNLDLGAAWMHNNYRVAVAVKDVIAQEVDLLNPLTGEAMGTYHLDAQVTLGAAYKHDFFTLAIDADLTKQKRFDTIQDDTQFVRIGVEGNAWGWAQLRAGYEIDLEETLDNTITAGLGISPFDVISLDIAANYAGENQLGASANLAFTF